MCCLVFVLVVVLVVVGAEVRPSGSVGRRSDVM